MCALNIGTCTCMYHEESQPSHGNFLGCLPSTKYSQIIPITSSSITPLTSLWLDYYPSCRFASWPMSDHSGLLWSSLRQNEALSSHWSTKRSFGAGRCVIFTLEAWLTYNIYKWRWTCCHYANMLTSWICRSSFRYPRLLDQLSP